MDEHRSSIKSFGECSPRGVAIVEPFPISGKRADSRAH
ncbi:hypothetical protein STVIR_4421 [Streptomyces viridochromogenes Tue57]|uniref:Uncharacterized protein n=1 Tax=Streptomyces viridochromogenes Tue57 TaxID=1160705 RepID=L8PAI3_STRVR|nr:hypothetical protein STVIR_4421 [Streptomyces viridochromogenes Tue57]